MLLLDGSASPLAERIRGAAERAAVPLAVPDRRDAGLTGLYQAPLALVHPDQFVARRGSDANADGLVGTVRGAATAGEARNVETGLVTRWRDDLKLRE